MVYSSESIDSNGGIDREKKGKIEEEKMIINRAKKGINEATRK